MVTLRLDLSKQIRSDAKSTNQLSSAIPRLPVVVTFLRLP